MIRYFNFRSAAFLLAGGGVGVLFLSGAANAITDTIFKYSTPKTGYYSLSPLHFAPGDGGSANSYETPWPQYLRTFGSNACFNTGLNLPQGAVITSYQTWYSTDLNGSVDAYLFRTNLTDGSFSTITRLLSTNTTQNRTTMKLNVTPASLATVNNAIFAYSVGFCLKSPSARYYGGRVNYTYSTAGD
jgi:hypothetical protein